ncbi:hypothetical protein K0H59_20290 [Shewanella sp. FJAT-51649]|uniref:polymorphic toxin type 44 domain-containing protein n=1 Tax=Shewanella sp. FJAT-51649 TaxID=2864210 RepID=UPI001C656AF3|nr:polymorphic toxin type 44 domain-containing protein [Shewanella sp. FJAT-51649]QYJ71318.1 hypothetical protein K0H59_20290 [Shewanella sp. FJAT-51649]
MKKYLAATIISFISFNLYANTENCALIEPNSTMELTIKRDNNFTNCFKVGSTNEANEIQITVLSTEKIKNNVTLFSINPDSTAEYVAEYLSDDDSTNAIGLKTYNREIGFEIKPKTYTQLDKNIRITHLTYENTSQLVIEINNVATPPKKPNPDDGTCRQVGGKWVCRAPKVIQPPQLFAQGLAANTCSADQKPPQDKNKNFDINKHLSQFTKAGKAASRLPAGGLGARVAIMTSMFYSGRKYDLKNNPGTDYKSGQNFGNWFYGAAAHELGFSESDALKAGAIVQQYQNYNYKNNPNYNDIGALVTNLTDALITGNGDNPDDPGVISGGYSYAQNIYSKDPKKDSNSDSCNSNSVGTGTASNGDTAYGGGWSTGVFIGTGTCYGNCGYGASGSVTIIDFPYPRDQN